MRLPALLIVLGSFTVCRAAQADTSEQRITLAQGQVALKAAEKSGAPEPQLAALLDTLGRLEFDAGRYRNAKKYFERELRLSAIDTRNRAVALSNAGNACLALGEVRQANRYFLAALDLLPRQAKVWHSHGQALLAEGKVSAAEAAYRNSLAIDAYNPIVVHDLAVLLIRKNNIDEGVRMLRAALKAAEPGRQRARMIRNLAVLECRTGSCETALPLLQEAVVAMEAAVGKEHPDMARLLNDYSEVLAKVGAKAASIEARERAKSIEAAFVTQGGAGAIDFRELLP